MSIFFMQVSVRAFTGAAAGPHSPHGPESPLATHRQRQIKLQVMHLDLRPSNWHVGLSMFGNPAPHGHSESCLCTAKCMMCHNFVRLFVVLAELYFLPTCPCTLLPSECNGYTKPRNYQMSSSR